MNKMNLNNKKKMNKKKMNKMMNKKMNKKKMKKKKMNKKKMNKMMNKKMNKKKMKKKKYHLEFIVMVPPIVSRKFLHQMNLLQIIWVKILNLYFKRKELKLCLKQRSC